MRQDWQGREPGNSCLRTVSFSSLLWYCAEKPTVLGLGETLEEVVELDPGERPDRYRLGTRLTGRLPVHMSLTKATLQKLEPLQSGWATMQQAVVDRGVQQEQSEVALPRPQVGRSDWRPPAGSGHTIVAGSLLQGWTEILGTLSLQAHFCRAEKTCQAHCRCRHSFAGLDRERGSGLLGSGCSWCSCWVGDKIPLEQALARLLRCVSMQNSKQMSLCTACLPCQRATSWRHLLSHLAFTIQQWSLAAQCTYLAVVEEMVQHGQSALVLLRMQVGGSKGLGQDYTAQSVVQLGLLVRIRGAGLRPR